MKTEYRQGGLVILIVAVLVLPFSSAFAGLDAPAPAQNESVILDVSLKPLGLKVNHQSNQGFTIDYIIPDLHFSEVVLNGQTYVDLEVDGFGSEGLPGLPSLPQTGILFGLPPSGGWTAEILDVEQEILPLELRVAPSPGFISDQSSVGVAAQQATKYWSPEASVYAKDSLIPSSLIDLGEVSLFRDLRVARLGFRPVRYNPARGVLEYTRRLVVQVRFDDPSAPVQQEPDLWDEIFRQSLINFEVAKGWRGVRPDKPTVDVNPQAQTPDVFKAKVDADGLYEITYSDLLAAGFPLAGMDSDNIHLMSGGQEVAIQVDVGLDGVLSRGDRILFYGQAAEGRFTKTNIYWLYEDGTPGLRMNTRSVDPQDQFPAPLARWIGTSFEENYLYDGIHPEASGDHWYWLDLAFLQTECYKGVVLTQAFELPHLWAGTHTATFRIGLQGYTGGEHFLKAWLNGHHVGNAIWYGENPAEGEFHFPAEWLQKGSNTLVLENGRCPPVPPPAPPPNGMLLSYFKVEHLATYSALNNRLDFSGEAGSRQYRVGGFSTSNLFLLDLSNPALPVILEGAGIEANSRLVFEDVASEPRRYLAAAQYHITKPLSFYKDTPSNLGKTFAGADYLMISYHSFLPAIQSLAVHRADQGLSVMTVDIQDVYDEFTFGVVDPHAIKRLLAFVASEWDPVPDYVLLVGDGTIDFHNYTGNGWRNYIPAYPAYVDLRLGPEPVEAATDNELDPSPDLPIFMMGRLPVASASEAHAVVSKILQYEKSPVAGFWNRKLLFVADDDDPSGPFTKYSDDVYESVAAPLVGSEVHLAQDPEPHEYNVRDQQRVSAARDVVLNAFRQGQLLVTYMGHSSFSQWAQESLLHRDDVPTLKSEGRLPVVLSMTCYTSAFHHPNFDPIDERLILEPQGGAVATWGATGAGVATGHRHLAQGFLSFFQEAPIASSGGEGARSELTVGAATLAGLARLYTQAPTNRDLIDTYVLFGDPATRINRYTGTAFTAELPVVIKSE